MPTRRELLAGGLAAAGVACLTQPRAARAADITTASELSSANAMTTRPIPASGEQLPVIGMGTSGSFEVGSSAAERDPLREVVRRFFAGGGTLIDTAPSYGTAEEVVGSLLDEAGLRSRAFIATKLSSHGRDAGRRQFEQSLRRLKTDRVELLQVHNLRDWQTQFALIEELKAEGRVRYSGLTHYLDAGHDDLADVVRAVKPDFIQINYSVVSINAERRLFPLVRDQGVAVLVNRAFDDGRLFAQVGGKPLPPWADEAGITSWAQAFLKFALSHPAVTVVIPATGKPERQSDNLRAGSGPRLTEEQRRALIALFA